MGEGENEEPLSNQTHLSSQEMGQIFFHTKSFTLSLYEEKLLSNNQC